MDETDTRLARLERRVRVLSVLVGMVGGLALVCGALSASQTYLMREARSQHAFAKRKIDYLEMRLRVEGADDEERFLALERQARTMGRDMRGSGVSTVRGWLLRADRDRTQNRARIECLEQRVQALQDSLRSATSSVD